MRSVWLLLAQVVFVCTAFAQGRTQPVDKDSLVSVLEMYPQGDLQRTKHLFNVLQKGALYTDALVADSASVAHLLEAYEPEKAAVFINLFRAFNCRRMQELGTAEKHLKVALAAAKKNEDDHLLLYYLYNNLAFVNTDQNDAFAAIRYYRLSLSYASRLADIAYLANTYVNLSDVYTNVQLYDQALEYLYMADAIYANNLKKNARLRNIVYYNKGEVFFKLGMLDSLRYYKTALVNSNEEMLDKEQFITRMFYYERILSNDYGAAATAIRGMVYTVPQYYYRAIDMWHLASCYHKMELYDSAKLILHTLVQDSLFCSRNILRHSCKLLSQLAEREGDTAKAYHYNKRALALADTSIASLIQIGDLTAQLHADQREQHFLAKTELYEKERTILIIIIIASVLLVLVTALFYYEVKQKRRYERLLQQSKEEELAYLSSHDVRKHLANILGLSELLNYNPTEEEAKQYFKYMFESAQEMDESLKRIVKRLEDKH